MNLFELIYIHTGVFAYGFMFVYTIVKCVRCEPLAEVFSDSDDKQK